jgi:hypothetical protein
MVRKSLWEDGTLQMTPQVLMTLVENHYRMRIEDGTWKAMTKKDERIVALKATSGSAMTKDERDKKYAWKKIEPATEEQKREIKKFEGREYHWCTKHKSWTMHTDAQCEGVGVFKGNKSSSARNVSNEATNNKRDEGNNKSAPNVRIDPALSANVQYSGGTFVL